jgi:rubrerythrin
MVGEKALDSWLASYDEEEIILIATSLDDDRPMPLKVCRTCGTEFRGIECPRCREVRIRLRGR